MNIEVVAKEGLRRELTIVVPVEIVDAAFGKIYKELQKKAEIKGFRPGKAPVNIIRSRFKGEATAEVIDELVQKYYAEAIREKNLEPAGNPILSKVDVDEGKPLNFTIGIEVLPTIDTIQYDNLTLPEVKIEVPDTEVDHLIDHLRKATAELRSVERPATVSDILICDIEAIGGETAVLGGQALPNQEIDLSHEHTLPEFKAGLVGARREETKEIIVKYSDDYSDQQFAGKSVTYKMAVKEIKERILPALDDFFAKQSGMGETLLELRLNVRKRLEEDQRADHLREDKRKIIDQVVGKNQIDVPEVMVESYLKGVIEDLKKHEEQIEEPVIRERYRPLGQNTIRWYLLYHRLAELEKIEVTSEDTENWVKRFAESYKMEIPRAKEVIARSGRGGEIRDGLLEGKVLDLLLAKAARVKA